MPMKLTFDLLGIRLWIILCTRSQAGCEVVTRTQSFIAPRTPHSRRLASVPLKSPALPNSTEKPSLSASLGNYKRDSYNGYGNGLAKAFELTMTPALFGGIGYLIDRRTDTKPWFTVCFVVFAIVGMFVKMWFSYDDEMKHHEKSMVTSKRPVTSSKVATGSDRSSTSAPRSITERATLPTGVTLETGLTLETAAQRSGSAEL